MVDLCKKQIWNQWKKISGWPHQFSNNKLHNISLKKISEILTKIINYWSFIYNYAWLHSFSVKIISYKLGFPIDLINLVMASYIRNLFEWNIYKIFERRFSVGLISLLLTTYMIYFLKKNFEYLTKNKFRNKIF